MQVKVIYKKDESSIIAKQQIFDTPCTAGFDDISCWIGCASAKEKIYGICFRTNKPTIITGDDSRKPWIRENYGYEGDEGNSGYEFRCVLPLANSSMKEYEQWLIDNVQVIYIDGGLAWLNPEIENQEQQ